jgi:hypothetical protein
MLAFIMLRFRHRQAREWLSAEASPSGLCLIECGIFKQVKLRLDAEELEDLRIETQNGKTVLAWIGASASYRFDGGLTPGEIAWLRQGLLRAMFPRN